MLLTSARQAAASDSGIMIVQPNHTFTSHSFPHSDYGNFFFFLKKETVTGTMGQSSQTIHVKRPDSALPSPHQNSCSGGLQARKEKRQFQKSVSFSYRSAERFILVSGLPPSQIPKTCFRNRGDRASQKRSALILRNGKH